MKKKTTHKYWAIVRDNTGNQYISAGFDKIKQIRYARMSMLIELDLMDQFQLVIDNNSVRLMMDEYKVREWMPSNKSDININSINSIYNYWIDNLKHWNTTTQYRYCKVNE